MSLNWDLDLPESNNEDNNRIVFIDHTFGDVCRYKYTFTTLEEVIDWDVGLSGDLTVNMRKGKITFARGTWSTIEDQTLALVEDDSPEETDSSEEEQ